MIMNMSMYAAYSRQQEILREIKSRCLIEVAEEHKPTAQRRPFRFRLPRLFSAPTPVWCAAECKG